ncbi:MAG: hypothetical protein HRT99_04040 [Mycoplasmatales bacterium]|nr:hypothetical protein [Mycoplasmatales bacterium]
MSKKIKKLSLGIIGLTSIIAPTILISCGNEGSSNGKNDNSTNNNNNKDHDENENQNGNNNDNNDKNHDENENQNGNNNDNNDKKTNVEDLSKDKEDLIKKINMPSYDSNKRDDFYDELSDESTNLRLKINNATSKADLEKIDFGYFNTIRSKYMNSLSKNFKSDLIEKINTPIDNNTKTADIYHKIINERKKLMGKIEASSNAEDLKNIDLTVFNNLMAEYNKLVSFIDKKEIFKRKITFPVYETTKNLAAYNAYKAEHERILSVINNSNSSEELDEIDFSSYNDLKEKYLISKSK